jgi:hypothetical protein
LILVWGPGGAPLNRSGTMGARLMRVKATDKPISANKEVIARRGLK